MDFVIQVAFALLIYIFSWLYQEQNQAWDEQRQLLKAAGNLATHDAVQMAVRDPLNEGKLVIDRAAAYQRFLRTLGSNLGLSDSLSPLPGSPIFHQVRIIDFEIIDETMVTFPYLYNNPTYRIAKELRGPAVVAILETEHPRLVQSGGSQKSIRVPAIYEYAE